MLRKIKKLLSKEHQIELEKREETINFAMWCMDWPRRKAASAVDKARKEYGISYTNFALMELCRYPEEEWKQRNDDRTALRSQRKKEKEKKYVTAVCNETGWSYEDAEAKMKRAKKNTGASFENYFNFRFWELSEEIQKTYYTKGDVIALRRKYNTNAITCNISKNKSLTLEYLKDYIGRKWIKTEDITPESFRETFGASGKVIYKPATSNGGTGIEVFEYNADQLEAVVIKIQSLKEGIVEAYLEQHEVLSRFSKNSINTIRVVTISTKKNNLGIEPNKVHFLFAGIRMAGGDSVVDNMHQGGLTAALDLDTGELISDGINYKNELFANHPDTGYPIKGTVIPYVTEMKQMIEAASTKVQGFLGWDIAISPSGPVIIEINTSPGAGVLQSPHVHEKKGMRYVVEPYL